MSTACILTIGDELLQGYTVDTNSSWIGKQLLDHSIQVIKKISVGDDTEVIKKEIESSRGGQFQYVFITGGLGPTLDDITLKAFAEVFDLKESFDECYFEILKDRFCQQGLQMPDNNRSQAIVLKCCDIIANPIGSARCMHFDDNGTQYFMLPGVPKEMKAIFSEGISPDYLPEKDQSPVRMILTTGLFESKMAEFIQSEIDQYSDRYQFSFLPQFTGVNFKIRQSDMGCHQGIDYVSRHFYKCFQPYAYGWEGDSLAAKLVENLRQRKFTVSIAESCTGGMLSKAMTDVPGCSEIFKGSIIAYDNEIKINRLDVPFNLIKQYGAVSEEIVEAMAITISQKFKTDFGIATTGISGPSGGSEEKPVGLVYISISFRGKLWTKKFNFFPERDIHRQMTTQAALNMVRKLLYEK